MSEDRCTRGHCLHPLTDDGMLPNPHDVMRCCWCGWEGVSQSQCVFGFTANAYASGHGRAGAKA
jgi:hypothetical protein